MTSVQVPGSTQIIAEAIGVPAEQWLNSCHSVSFHVVRSGLLGEPGPRCRVVRGAAPGYGIGGQHSWIALGTPYDPECVYVDVTLHRWDNEVDDVFITTAHEAFISYEGAGPGHVIHGYDETSIFEFGRPAAPEGPGISLDTSGLSEQARSFLDILGPLDEEGWGKLCQYPQGGWPYREIVNAVIEQLPRTQTYLPIDIVGMATDRNPNGLYW